MDLLDTRIGWVGCILAIDMNKNIKKGFLKSAFADLLCLPAAHSIASVSKTTSNRFSINLLSMDLLILTHSHVHHSCVSPLGTQG